MTGKMCARCVKAYAGGKPKYFMSDPQCAFFTGAFQADNWNCGTANDLREVLYAMTEASDSVNERVVSMFGLHGVRLRMDDESAGILHADGGRYELGGYVFLAWYKERGATSMIADSEGTPLRVEMAEKLLLWAEANGWKRAEL